MDLKKELQLRSKEWLDQVLQQTSVGLLLAGLILLGQPESIMRIVSLFVCATVGLSVSFASRILPTLTQGGKSHE